MTIIPFNGTREEIHKEEKQQVIENFANSVINKIGSYFYEDYIYGLKDKLRDHLYGKSFKRIYNIAKTRVDIIENMSQRYIYVLLYITSTFLINPIYEVTSLELLQYFTKKYMENGGKRNLTEYQKRIDIYLDIMNDLLEIIEVWALENSITENLNNIINERLEEADEARKEIDEMFE